LRFPASDGKQDQKQDHERNIAARTVLAALGLVAIVEQWQQGYFLRSRCDLVRENPELVIERVTSATVSDDERFTLTPNEAIALLNEAVEAAAEKNIGLKWQTEPIRLTPKPSLVAMVRKSRELELSGEVDGEEVSA